MRAPHHVRLRGTASTSRGASVAALTYTEAVARIRAAHPDAVTLNETCRGDVGRITRRTGYHLRFSTVTVAGRPLPCIRPGGRGRFGDAVLTKAAVDSADGHDFAAQAGVDVCTAHFATERAANDAQCAELTALLARRAATRTVMFGGDVNRTGTCAPERAWSRSDRSAGEAPGLRARCRCSEPDAVGE
jgi:hypothetical protein